MTEPAAAQVAATPEAGAPPPWEERLPLGVILAYGAPTFAGAAMAIPIAVHLSIFYADAILVPLGFIAVVKAIARAFDAITDPLMGWLSDRTRTRWGRRLPWMALGAPLTSVAFVAMFWPPEQLSVTVAALWFCATYVLYYLFHTVYSIPHYGLGAELTLDYKDRVRLFGWEKIFVLPGTLLAAVLPGVLQEFMGPREAMMTFSLIFGGLLTLLFFNLVYRVRERPDFVSRPPNPLVPGVRRVMRNRVFRILLAVYLTGSLTGAIPGTLMPFYTTYVLAPENPARWISIYLAIYFGSGFLCFPFWIWAARRFGKKQAWLASFLPGTTGSVCFFLLGQGDLLPAALVLIWAGVSFSAGMTIGPAMQADVIDYDELYTGRRREAQYGSLWSVLTKFMVIPSMAVPLAVLASFGYVPNVEQSETVKLVIKAIFALAPAATGVLGFLIALFYPISEGVHRRIWEGIAAHRRGEHVVDPLTGRLVRAPSDRGIEEETGWFLDHFAPRELRRHLASGAGTLLRSAGLTAALSLAICGAGSWVAILECRDLVSLSAPGEKTQPGLLAVFAIVVAGFALTAFCFHAVRFRAARRMAREPVPDAIVLAHVELTEHLIRGELAPVEGDPEPQAVG